MGMTKGDLKRRGWEVIDDDPDNPHEVSDTLMDDYVDELYEDLAEPLDITKSATLTFSVGVASVPADFLRPLAVYEGDTLIQPISDINEKVDSISTSKQYYLQNISEIRWFGATPTGTVTLWYKATPSVMANDAAEPTYLPNRLRHWISEVGVKMKYALKVGKMGEYAGLDDMWRNVVKPEIASAIDKMRRPYGARVKARTWK